MDTNTAETIIEQVTRYHLLIIRFLPKVTSVPLSWFPCEELIIVSFSLCKPHQLD